MHPKELSPEWFLLRSELASNYEHIYRDPYGCPDWILGFVQPFDTPGKWEDVI